MTSIKIIKKNKINKARMKGKKEREGERGERNTVKYSYNITLNVMNNSENMFLNK